MADRKITDLTALAAGSQATGDLLTIVDVSEGAAADKNKKMTMEDLFKGIPGNVGIGTASPDQKLSVQGLISTKDVNGTTRGLVGSPSWDTSYIAIQNGTLAQAAANAALYQNNIGITSLNSASGRPLNFKIGNGERARIDSSGRVLVGTTTEGNGAADNLTVADSGNCGITIRSASTNSGSVYFSDGTSGDAEYRGYIQYQHPADVLTFATTATERMRIDSSGVLTVGSGANTATQRAAFLGGYTTFENSAGTGNPSITFNNDTDTGFLNPAGNTLAFNTGGTERMRIDSSGVVKLTQSGNNPRFGSLEASGDAFRLKAFSGNASHNATMQFFTGANSPTERMRITSGGQVLIGQTSMSAVLGTGLGVKSNDVGSNFNEGALALEGTGGDFYGLTFNKTGTTSSEGFGFLAVFSSATDSLQIGYNNGSSNVGILTCYANGNVFVGGALSKGSGSFRIDHPLPAKTETHDLVHSFIEGPQADLIYRGKVDLVAGAATVNLDTAARMTEGTFVLLNTNVQCFTSNESDWTAVRGSVSGNTLTIAAEDNTSTATVSWLVIGERQDQHMIDTDWTDDNGRVITEPEKPS